MMSWLGFLATPTNWLPPELQAALRVRAMTVPIAAVTLLLTTISSLLVLSHTAQKIPRCQEGLWNITYAASAEEGEADVVITVPRVSEKLLSVSSILTCEDLVVNGTGKAVLQLNKGHNTTLYHVSVPEAKTKEEFESQGEWQTHSCILQFIYHSPHKTSDTVTEQLESNKGHNKEEMECELQLQTVLGRILPKCSLTRASQHPPLPPDQPPLIALCPFVLTSVCQCLRFHLTSDGGGAHTDHTHTLCIIQPCLTFPAQALLKEVEVSRALGQVLLTFYNSGNDVFTHDSKCDVGSLDEHSHSEALEENMIPLAPPGADPPIIEIDFYPDCDNETVLNEYRDREMSQCHMELYQVCQGGHQLVKKIELDFDEGALKCEPPKPSYQVLLESLELVFYIESQPVVALLLLLLCNGVLYTLLIPAVICQMVRGKCSRTTATAEEKQPLLDHQQSPPESPVHPHTSPPSLTNTSPPAQTHTSPPAQTHASPPPHIHTSPPAHTHTVQSTHPHIHVSPPAHNPSAHPHTSLQPHSPTLY